MKISGFILHKDFKKTFSKLQRGIKDTFEERSSIFISQPSHIVLNNHPLGGTWEDHWSINITGDIRAIYRIEENIAIFVAIRTHGQLYK
ncbi:MAG: hypothetical protein A3C79_03360 [Candidatus Taylorbacteria bacterium RIFCSPHIGHO2_02_FULL_45_28]|uniref:Type II toxin-antitoxin system mRNA interferase toxin, RelE/StbE family n=1 Tax=Candidatus Taylorbacteria bacterium RIFCSPHIGHO2_12_FULL_45_16 TaxID=1802315 RepID=A0A1G2N3D1_9BACT|nr:MAG: hypothetical protein A2830_01075 [Candidatus Taylorbacteria bacterium RIFCSPHIGHO2_01_FULL_44_110]OHA24995.1 MAG: hypothetical protein A3C79_03360 [Candidatus Taylorbacteria bacterium RIFCSPHIGHO2_02_FULL_45_28]OHA29812.1 MAG: hypothetical protein A3F51_03770 [Candidatus Taylorbacteria bacterium RIFCSPHIGHO2_12_FULL_45_16]OHA32756.1 MAG: hypothetical protein A3A23_00640 [Candidatus Taylorbacteria bacterium RIFCSPLOWO2_01_FULL_45_59]OHA39051.1 MAG: hypothetical protein A3I98_00225 [Candi